MLNVLLNLRFAFGGTLCRGRPRQAADQHQGESEFPGNEFMHDSSAQQRYHSSHPGRWTPYPSVILIGLLEATSGGTYMPEHRARKHHQDRVAETLREEIGAMIEGELSDPRIAFCYVTEVVLNPGGKSARVYVAVDNAVPDIAKAEVDTVAGLEAAKGYIRFELKERMGVRHVPELSFLADRSGRFQARIEELMDRSRKRQKAPVE